MTIMTPAARGAAGATSRVPRGCALPQAQPSGPDAMHAVPPVSTQLAHMTQAAPALQILADWQSASVLQATHWRSVAQKPALPVVVAHSPGPPSRPVQVVLVAPSVQKTLDCPVRQISTSWAWHLDFVQMPEQHWAALSQKPPTLTQPKALNVTGGFEPAFFFFFRFFRFRFAAVSPTAARAATPSIPASPRRERSTGKARVTSSKWVLSISPPRDICRRRATVRLEVRETLESGAEARTGSAEAAATAAFGNTTGPAHSS